MYRDEVIVNEGRKDTTTVLNRHIVVDTLVKADTNYRN